MDHRTIDAENIAEHYVTGRLPPAETARFEEHFLDCPACCARVEAAERLQRGMKRLAEAAAIETPAVSRFSRWSRSPQWGLAAAALLAVAILPAAYELREARRLRADLETTRGALAHAEADKVSPDRLAALEAEVEKTRQDLAGETAKRDALVAEVAAEVAAARRPQANVPVLPLAPLRDAAGGGPVRTLTLPREPGWVALWVEPGEEYPAYRAVLRDAKGAVVFQAAGLKLNDLGALLLTLHSTSLPPGSYRLEVDGLPKAGAAVPVARYPLRVVAGG